MWYASTDNWHKFSADINQLAKEAYEDIMGFVPGEEGEGHKPPRDDIAKLKKIWELKEQARAQTKWHQDPDRDRATPEDVPPAPEAVELWDKMTRLTPAEKEIFDDFERATLADNFEGTVKWYEDNYPDGPKEFSGSWHYTDEDPESWKDTLATAIRKRMCLRRSSATAAWNYKTSRRRARPCSRSSCRVGGSQLPGMREAW